MSFHSSVSFVRSGPAPRVNTASLAAVLQSAATLPCFRGASSTDRFLNLRFGRRVDRDRKDTSPASRRVIGGVEMMTLLPYPWDLSIAPCDLVDASVSVAREARSIYRAEIGLGALTPEVHMQLTRDPSPENSHPLRLESVSIEIGPIQNATLSSPDPVHVGWVALRISGPEYFYPWTPAVAIDRVRAIPDLMALAQLLATAWPAPPAPSTDRSLLRRVQQLIRPGASWQWIAGESG